MADQQQEDLLSFGPRLRAGWEDLFVRVFPPYPIPELPRYGRHLQVDRVVVSRMVAVFEGKLWNQVSAARYLQFGYDLEFFRYLDLRARAYYMPSLAVASMSSVEILGEFTSTVTWLEWAPGREPARRSVWAVWDELQGSAMRLFLETLRDAVVKVTDDWTSARLSGEIDDILALSLSVSPS